MTNDTRIPPLVKTVTVPLNRDAAFRRFTEQMAAWWPLATHSVGEADAESVTFGAGTGEAITERLRDGTEHVWGTVLDWDPPRRVTFTWHPGRDASRDQVVDVVFRESGGCTEVELTHTGWDSLGDQALELRSGYDQGWGKVLGFYADVS